MTSATKAITQLKVRSFITNIQNDQQIKIGEPTLLKGIAFDSGSGIKQVELSPDGGLNWVRAKLGKELGKYSFREWQLRYKPTHKGNLILMVRATTNAGETQPLTASWNPGGYIRNVVETTKLTVV